MQLKWKIYKFLLVVNILLSFACIALYSYASIVLRITFTSANLLLIIATVIIVFHAINFLWIINKRFPEKGLTSIIEGLAYTLNIVISVSCLYILFYVSIISSIFIDKFQNDFQLYKNIFFIAIVLFFFLAVLSIIALIFSFQILSFLSKNRSAILSQIDSIGKS